MVSPILLDDIKASSDKYSTKDKIDKFQLLSEYQFQALIGLTLGDVHVRRLKPTANANIRFEQSLAHESYLFYLYVMFKNLVATPPMSPKRKPHKVTGKIYPSLTFSTLAIPSLNIFHELFYNTGKKGVPHNISDYFSEVSFAFWIMDDGTKAVGALKMCTESFTYSDILILIDMLKTEFDIQSSPQKRGVTGWRIYIPRTQMDKVRNLVKPHMHPEMLYKIGL
jgi:hypothetical protein